MRLYEGTRFCYTRIHVPMELGRRLRDLPGLAGLAEPAARGRVTVISLIERVSDRPMHDAWPDATAEAPSAELARRLGCAAGVPVLRIDRLQLRRVDPAGAGAGAQ